LSLAGKFTDLTPDSLGAHPGAHVHVGTVSGHAPADAIIIPDAHLLFTGDFKRAGVDLVVSGDGHEVVLHDYFKGEKRAALASPDGAHLTGDIINALTGHTQFAQADGSASVAQVIGHVTKLTGTATAIRNGVSIILNQGDNVNKGDVVASGSDSTLGITFIDGTVFGLASNAKMVLNEMIYDPNGSDNKSLISLVQGTISFVAGATAKHGDMKVDTPVATMGIRGTAVLVEIDFTVPANGGAPPAKFQVLVEPDGTTGSYILFDKTTLTPIATVNQAGTQTIVNGQGGVNFLSSAQLSADAQKIITDVFALKFSDLNNPNTKTATNSTDTIIPFNTFIKLANGDSVPVQVLFGNLIDKPASVTPGASIASREHVPGPPTVGTDNGATTERALTTGSAVSDTVTGAIAYGDAFNPGDVPTVKTSFTSFTYQNAGHTDVTAALTAEQLAAIHAVEIPLAVVQDPTNLNIGVAHWTYNIADGAFDFLAAGEVLTLTYTAHVDNNFAPNNEFKEVTFTITITGTNDTPTIATSGNTITERVGSGNTATDTASGTVTFTDVDLTDRPIVSAALSASHPFQYLDAQGHDVTATLTPEQLAAITAVESTLTVVQAAGNANNGSATWTYSVVDKAFDFLAKGEILTLNYVAQVDDGHGGVVSTPITVSINGADVSVTGTNDVPTIVPESTTATGAMTEDAAATLTADGTITFQDLDLTDTHTAAFVLKSSDATANLPGYSEAAPLSQIGAFALTAISESPGNSTIGSVGWTFTLDDSDPVLQSLAKGQTITQIYTVTLTDNNGASVTQDVTVTITGTNDAPVITVTNPDVVTEGNTGTPDPVTVTIAHQVAITDVDTIDVHTLYVAGTLAFDGADSTGPAPSGGPLSGLFTIDQSNGTVSYDKAAFDYLAGGEHVVATFTFDASSGPDTLHKTIAITINGENDAPTIAVTNPAAVIEGNTGTPDPVTVAVADHVTIADVDASDVHTLYVAGTLAFDAADSIGPAPSGGPLSGLFTVGQSNGTVSYDKAAFDYLASGEHVVATFTFDASSGLDALHKTIAITINGENDAPTITVTNPAAVAEGNTGTPDPVTLAVADHVTIADVDASDVHTLYVAGTLAFDAADSSGPAPSGGSLSGLFTIDQSSGTVSYDKAAFDYLAGGQNVVATFTFDASSGTDTLHKTITVTIDGINDAPVFSGDAAGTAYAANGAAVAIATNVVASDIDSAHYTGGTLTATVIAGGHEGDTLSIASNLISVSGNEIWFDADGAGPGVAVDIGTLTNNGINSLTVTLNSGADDAAVAALTQAIEFSNSKSAPVAGTRTVAFTLHDGGGTDNGGHDSAYFTADVTVAASNHAPVIETDQFVVTDNHDNGTTKVSGLYVTDADSSDTYTLSATTGAAPESSVTPSTAGPGATLADINTTLSHGIVYNPDTDHDADQPDTDSVTLTVADNFGATDTVHFIFNNDDEGPITLTGTSGKDLIFSTGNNDTLTGGAGADQFVFKPSGNANSDTITDFAPGQDHIDLRAFSGTVDSSNLSTWLASHAVVSPANSADVLITLDAHDSVTLKNVALGNLHVGDFIVSPHA
jgi:VCBS repeat-containing protein